MALSCCLHLCAHTIQIQEWLFTIGYTLAYGALLSKLWRVYTIFNTPAPKKKVKFKYNMVVHGMHKLACINVKHVQIFKDWELMVLTLIVTGVAACLLFLGSVIPPLRGTISETTDPEYADGLSVRNTLSSKIVTLIDSKICCLND